MSKLWPVRAVFVEPLSCEAAPLLTISETALAHAQAALFLSLPPATESIQFAPHAGTEVKPPTKLPVEQKPGDLTAKLVETMLPLDYIADAPLEDEDEPPDEVTRKSPSLRPAHRLFLGSESPSELVIPT